MSKVSKITLFMLVDLTNEFLKYVLYLQTFLPGLLPHCNLTYMTSERNYLTSSISIDMSYLKITFQTQFSGTSNTLINILCEHLFDKVSQIRLSFQSFLCRYIFSRLSIKSSVTFGAFGRYWVNRTNYNL